jgi:outer membrane protein assembly factor BamB
MKNRRFPTLMLTVLAFTATGYSQVTAQWRGVNRDGIFPVSGLMQQWPEKGPSMLWSAENIGNGYSSPVASGNTVYTSGEIEGTGFLFAFTLQGNLLWKTPYGTEYPSNDTSSQKYSGPRSTPTVVDDRVYCCSGLGRICCMDARNGSELWAVDMIREFGGLMPEGGYAESLLVDGDMVYCYPGGIEKNAAAINRFTGKTVWTSGVAGDSVSYCSPLVINLPGRKILVNLTSKFLSGLDAGSGELLWSQKQEKMKYNNQFATPVYADGCIYYISESGNGAIKLELSPDGKSIREIWHTRGIKNGLNSPVKINGYMYYSDARQKIRCLDLNSGNIVDSLRVTRGPLFMADNRLYCYSENGTASLIKFEGPGMELVSSFKIGRGTREHLAQPFIDKGVMYVRHGDTLMAYDISND